MAYRRTDSCERSRITTAWSCITSTPTPSRRWPSLSPSARGTWALPPLGAVAPSLPGGAYHQADRHSGYEEDDEGRRLHSPGAPRPAAPLHPDPARINQSPLVHQLVLPPQRRRRTSPLNQVDRGELSGEVEVWHPEGGLAQAATAPGGAGEAVEPLHYGGCGHGSLPPPEGAAADGSAAAPIRYETG